MTDSHHPPKWILALFRWLCHPDYKEDLEGDLLERFEIRIQESGIKQARRGLIRDVLKLLRPALMRPIIPTPQIKTPIPMLQNYLLVAFRNLVSHKLYTGINIIGLTLGVTVSILIMLFVTHEMRVDAFHENGANIVKIKAEVNYGGQIIYMTSMSAGLGPLLANASTEVKNFVRMRVPGRVVIHSDSDHKFFEDKFIFADSSFFSVFTFPILEGTKQSLDQPGKVFITPKTSKKYFGDESAIGKVLVYQNTTNLEVAGIVSPPPSNSSITFDFIASFSSLGLLTDKQESKQYHSTEARTGSYPTYLLLKDAADAESLANSIAGMANEKYTFEPFRGTPSNIGYLKIFASIAALVLILALVNYMNLTTARATTRAKEIGVRKVIGASRKAISIQFYLESALLTILSFGLAYMLVSLSLPYVRRVAGLSIDTHFLSSPLFLAMVVVLLVVCVFLAGGYPAVVLSRFRPVAVLKGRQSSAGSGWLRKGLTTFQFAVSVSLIISSLVIGEQLEFLRNQKIGMNKDQVLVVNLEGLGSSYLAFRNEVAALSGVGNVGQASVSLFRDGGMAGFFSKTPKTNEDVFINVMTVDAGFFNTLDIQWHKQLIDSLKPGQVIINESALGELKITEDDFGENLLLGVKSSMITGIVKDFNYASLKQKISGIVMYVADPSKVAESLGDKGSIYIRLSNAERVIAVVDQLKSIYDKHQPTAPFEYYFLDDAFNNLYQAEDRLAAIFRYFTFLAICIACLGLFGLVTFTTERRKKEIGIRTVFGASVSAILSLITKEFAWIVIVGFAVAAPLVWWAMESWLSDFPYRIALSAAMFVAGGSVVIGLALITIWLQAARAAGANPVESLRSE